MASTQTTQMLTLLQNAGLSSSAPPIYDLLKRLINISDGLSTDILSVQTALATTTGPTAPDVSGFYSYLTDRNIILAWTSLGAGYTYEIREGATWATANYVTTALGSSVPLNPRVVGSYTFLIKAINQSGSYSAIASSTVVEVPNIGSVSVTNQVISNNILFFWTPPTSSFVIDYYEILRDGILVGRVSGTFFAYFEVVGGTYSYTIRAVDIIGNQSPNEVSATITVGNPTDYINQAESVDTTFAGTKVNAYYESGVGLIAPVNLTETWAEHFSNNSWTTPQDQIDAGFPIYIQPSLSSASYQKVFDFGAAVSSIIADVSYNSIVINGSVTVTCSLETSLDNSTWSAPVSGFSLYSASLRYLRVTLTFTPSNTTHDLIRVFSVTAKLNVKLENDGDIVSAVSTDSGGTTVTFNKSFYTVNSIVATVKQTVQRYVVIDYDYTTVNPTTFKVLVFSDAGVRVSDTVGWHARGILAA